MKRWLQIAAWISTARARAVVLGATMLCCACIAAAAENGDGIATARQLYQAGQYRAAVEMLDRLLLPRKASEKPLALGTADITLSPEARLACLQLAIDANRASGRFEQALMYANRWLESVPLSQRTAGDDLQSKRAAALIVVADLQMALGQPKAAEATLRKIEPSSATGELNRSAPPADPIRAAEYQIRLARAVAVQGSSARSRAKSQWEQAETAASSAVEFCQANKLPKGKLLSSVRLEVECLTALNRQADTAMQLETLMNRAANNVQLQLDLASELAECRHNQHDFAAERDVLSRAITLQQQLGRNQPPLAHAALFNRLGSALAALGQTQPAENAWRSAAKLYQSVVDEASAVNLNPANQTVAAKTTAENNAIGVLQGLEEIDLHLADWTDGVAVARQLVDRLQARLCADDPALVRANMALGAFLAKADDWQAAQPLLDSAAEFWRKHTPASPADLAGTLLNSAEIARSRGNYAAAQAQLEEAVVAYRTVLAADDLKLADTLSNLAAVQNARGQFRGSLANFTAAAAVCCAPANADDLHAQELLGTLLLNESMLYKAQRQFAAAAEVCEQSLAIQRKLHPAADDPAQLPFHTALASLYFAQDGSPADESSATFLNSADATQPRSGAVESSSRSNQSTTDRNPSADDLLRQADLHIQAALGLCRQHGLLEKPAAANVLHLAAMLEFRRGHFDAAANTWRQMLALAKQTGQTALAAQSLNYLAQVAAKQNNFAEAETISQQGVQLQETVQAYPALYFMALVNRAQVLRKLDRKPEALDCLHQAIAAIEAPRAETTGGEANRAEYFSQFAPAFDLLVDWSVDDRHYDDALSCAEAGRNRTFLDQVRAAGVDPRDSLRGTPQEHLLADEQQILTDYH
ncbi:MAG TPA: tetratricopeptide repeat protein, partial [Pirellulales bacterium]